MPLLQGRVCLEIRSNRYSRPNQTQRPIRPRVPSPATYPTDRIARIMIRSINESTNGPEGDHPTPTRPRPPTAAGIHATPSAFRNFLRHTTTATSHPLATVRGKVAPSDWNSGIEYQKRVLCTLTFLCVEIPMCGTPTALRAAQRDATRTSIWRPSGCAEGLA
jgi:hypothetical protein